MLENLGDLLLGCTHSYRLNEDKADDDTVRAGQHDLLSVFTQFSGFISLVDIFDKVFKETYSTSIYDYKTSYLLYACVPLIHGMDYLVNNHKDVSSKTPTVVKNSLHWFKHNISSIYQIAAVASNIALLYLGHRSYSITSLSLITFGYLERSNCLPQTIRKVYHFAMPWLATAGAFYSDSKALQMVIVSDAIDQYKNWKSKAPSIHFEEANNTHHLSMKTFKKLNSKNLFYVAREHVSIAPFPQVPGNHINNFLQYTSFLQSVLAKNNNNWESSAVFSVLDSMLANNDHWISSEAFKSITKDTLKEKIKQLKIEFGKKELLKDTFDWDDNEVYSALDPLLKQDDRWMGSDAFKSITENNSPEEIKKVKITYAKEQFFSLVNNIKNQTIGSGSPLDYGTLTTYLNYIAFNLPKNPDHKQQIHLILRLAVGGGNYCGQGNYRELEEVATEILSTSKNETQISLKRRFLLILQQERYRIMQAYNYMLNQKHNTILKVAVGGGDTIHGFNFVANLLGDQFGLPDQGAASDKLNKLSFLSKLCLRGALWVFPENLWQDSTYRIPRAKNQGNDTKEKNIIEIEGYTPKRILETIKQAILDDQKLGNEIASYLTTWNNEIEAKQEDKDQFSTDLENIFTPGETSPFGTMGYDGKMVFNDHILQAVLVDMGILKP